MNNRYFEVQETYRLGNDLFVVGFDGEKQETITAYSLVWLHREGVEITVSEELESETLDFIVSEVADYGDEIDLIEHRMYVTPEDGASYSEKLGKTYKRKAYAIREAGTTRFDGYHYHEVPR